jgi:hypothetical protein
MLSFFQNAVLVAVTVAGSLLFMAGLNLAWPWEKRRVHNDLIGWQLSVLGTTYAVILGFMLYTVWTSFGAADTNTDLEANALVNTYRLSDGLPEPQRSEMRALTRSYADAALSQDWPQMAAGSVPEATLQVDRRLWETLIATKSTTPAEISAKDHALTELSSLTEHRRIRFLQSASRFPAVLWCVLLIGGTLTITSSCMFGSQSTALHGIQVFAFSLMISLGLVAIADINRPFQGSIHVDDRAFRRAALDISH